MAHILVVDDDEIVGEVFKEFLELDRHQVTLCSSGDEAEKVAEKEDFALIIVDLIMPGKEGLETIKDLRAHQEDVKIIATTGKNFQEGYDMMQAASILGADALLPKPFTYLDLQEVVRTLFNQK